MRISEASELTGLSKKAIRLYIAKGFLSPKTYENGYQDFSNDDVQTLLTIKKLRTLGLTIQKIQLLFDSPLNISTILSYHRVYLKERLEQTTLQIQATDSLLKAAIYQPNHPLAYHLNKTDIREYISDPDRPIDEIDAEMMLSSFWTLFSSSPELSEFQIFLWERIKKSYIQDNSLNLRYYRNIMCENLKSDNQLSLGIQTAHVVRSVYTKTANLRPEHYQDFLLQCCAQAEKFLQDDAWCQQWHSGTTLFNNGIKAAFSESISTIMAQFSPIFSAYHNNMQVIVRLFQDYYSSASGQSLKQLIDKKLGNTFSPNSFDDIVRLLLIPNETSPE